LRDSDSSCDQFSLDRRQALRRVRTARKSFRSCRNAATCTRRRAALSRATARHDRLRAVRQRRCAAKPTGRRCRRAIRRHRNAKRRIRLVKRRVAIACARTLRGVCKRLKARQATLRTEAQTACGSTCQTARTDLNNMRKSTRQMCRNARAAFSVLDKVKSIVRRLGWQVNPASCDAKCQTVRTVCRRRTCRRARTFASQCSVYSAERDRLARWASARTGPCRSRCRATKRYQRRINRAQRFVCARSTANPLNSNCPQWNAQCGRKCQAARQARRAHRTAFAKAQASGRRCRRSRNKLRKLRQALNAATPKPTRRTVRRFKKRARKTRRHCARYRRHLHRAIYAFRQARRRTRIDEGRCTWARTSGLAPALPRPL